LTPHKKLLPVDADRSRTTKQVSGYSALGSSRTVRHLGQIVKLIKLVERLAELDDEDTIYACAPWAEASDAIVALAV